MYAASDSASSPITPYASPITPDASPNTHGLASPNTHGLASPASSWASSPTESGNAEDGYASGERLDFSDVYGGGSAHSDSVAAQGEEDEVPCTSQVTAAPVTYVIERSKDPAVIVDHVMQFLTEYPQTQGAKPQDFACVFDVDDTLLHTFEDEVAIHPAGHALYHFCRDKGFRIVLVTARLGDINSLDYLQAQLRTLGYTGYHSISMVNQQHQFDASPALCKLRSRMDIGKPVLLNVGNRLVDLFLTPKCEDPVLLNTNPQTYYVFKGQHPDILCLKLPTN
jgi:hypothetical protein